MNTSRERLPGKYASQRKESFIHLSGVKRRLTVWVPVLKFVVLILSAINVRGQIAIEPWTQRYSKAAGSDDEDRGAGCSRAFRQR